MSENLITERADLRACKRLLACVRSQVNQISLSTCEGLSAIVIASVLRWIACVVQATVFPESLAAREICKYKNVSFSIGTLA